MRKLPASPPEDYEGTIANWCVELQKRGLWNGEGFYGDIEIPEKDYLDILKKCEERS